MLLEKFKKIIITGGAGFIGSAFIRNILKNSNSLIYNFDKLNYASDLESINNIPESEKNHFHYKIDLSDKKELFKLFELIKPDLVVHFAAESHVDRSINNPSNFIESNIVGTFNLLEASLKHWQNLNFEKKNIFRFHHVSTDEVFGSLGNSGYFDENTKYDPRSPYSASKASSDHLVRAWFSTYKLPISISNCSNNYGPFQFPDKLIPITILKLLKGEKIPVYGDGKYIRDWLHVEDHICALFEIINFSKVGKTYCIGGESEIRNIDLVKEICKLMDKYFPNNSPHNNLISFVQDRPGHDRRYAIDPSLIKKELNWEPKYNFYDGIEKTVEWYLNNLNWCKRLMLKSGYAGERIGL